jgi:hypothetical protein
MRLATGALAGVMAGGSLPARAEIPAESDLEAREAEAKRACDAGRVQEGARLLTELLRRTNDGTYIFNLGRCHQQNGQADKALREFRTYLRRPDQDPAAAAAARAYIAQLDPPPPAPAVNPPSDLPPALPAAAAVPSPAAPVVPPADLISPAPSPSPSPPGRVLRVAALVTGGVGLAGLVTGAAYALQTHGLEQEKREALERQDKPPEWFEGQDQKGERAERLQWLCLGVGGAALAAGGVLYYFGERAGHGDEASHASALGSVHATPLALPGLAGAVISGRF